MIDLNLLRENPEAIKASQRARGAEESLVHQAVSADEQWRAALQKFESLRAEQNASAKQVATAPKEEKSKLINEQIKTVYVDRVKTVKETEYVIQEKIKEVATVIDSKCELTPEAVSLINAAAKNIKPGEKK